MAIDKLIGQPFSDISDWSWMEYETTKIGGDEKVTEKPHGHPDKLAEVLEEIVDRINALIDVVATIPDDLEALKTEVAADIATLQTEVGSHEHAMGSPGAGAGGMEAGGIIERTKPIPTIKTDKNT